MRYVLDACALIAFLNDEDGGDTIDNLLIQSMVGSVSVSMSIVNLLEVYYCELREHGADTAQIVLDAVKYYGVEIVSTISAQTFHEAAKMKVAHKMSLGDSIGLATALEHDGVFVTSDHHELDAVAKTNPSLIFWYR